MYKTNRQSIPAFNIRKPEFSELKPYFPIDSQDFDRLWDLRSELMFIRDAICAARAEYGSVELDQEGMASFFLRHIDTLTELVQNMEVNREIMPC